MNKVWSAEMVVGARFETQVNAPGRPGELMWMGCDVLDATPEESLEGVEHWWVRTDAGARVRRALRDLRRVAQ